MCPFDRRLCPAGVARGLACTMQHATLLPLPLLPALAPPLVIAFPDRQELCCCCCAGPSWLPRCTTLPLAASWKSSPTPPPLPSTQVGLPLPRFAPTSVCLPWVVRQMPRPPAPVECATRAPPGLTSKEATPCRQLSEGQVCGQGRRCVRQARGRGPADGEQQEGGGGRCDACALCPLPSRLLLVHANKT